MTIAKDSSTPSAPAKTTSSTSSSIASASFSPPAGSLVVAMVVLGYDISGSSPSFTVKDSLGNSYSSPVTKFDTEYNYVGIFRYYYATAPGAITVTAQRSPASEAGFGIWPYILDGCAPNQTGAATASSSTTSGSAISASITTTQTGSTVLMVGAGGGSGDTMTPAASTTTLTTWSNTSEEFTAAYGQQSLPTASPAAETAGWTSSATLSGAFAALEILPLITSATRPVSPIPMFRASYY